MDGSESKYARPDVSRSKRSKRKGEPTWHYCRAHGVRQHINKGCAQVYTAMNYSGAVTEIALSMRQRWPSPLEGDRLSIAFAQIPLVSDPWNKGLCPRRSYKVARVDILDILLLMFGAFPPHTIRLWCRGSSRR